MSDGQSDNSKSQFSSEQSVLEAWRPQSVADLNPASLQLKGMKLAQAFGGHLPTAKELRNVTEELGVEIATHLLIEAIKLSPKHRDWLARLMKFSPGDLQLIQRDAREYEVTIVASNLAQASKEWGEHVEPWRRWARDLGFTTDVIETDAHVSIAENARAIQFHLLASRRPKRILLTYGQGATEVRFWLQKNQHKIMSGGLTQDLADVHGWINVCGAYGGCTSSQWLKSSRLRRLQTELRFQWRGRSTKALVETASDFSMWRGHTHVPRHWMVMNVFGLAYPSEMPSALRASSLELAKTMPSDGVVGALEALAPGYAIPILGMTHHAREMKLRPVLTRALALMCLQLQAQSLAPRQPARERAGASVNASADSADEVFDFSSADL